jgi:hypothetical protein
VGHVEFVEIMVQSMVDIINLAPDVRLAKGVVDRFDEGTHRRFCGRTLKILTTVRIKRRDDSRRRHGNKVNANTIAVRKVVSDINDPG